MKKRSQDRRYHYPKGFIDRKTKKAKTGFMPANKGAQAFVKVNIEDIKKGNIPFSSLTDREKRVFKNLTSTRKLNTYFFQGKRYFDPSGVIRQELDRIPLYRGQNKLDNLISEKNFKNLFNTFKVPSSKLQNLNQSLFDFVKGDEKYITERNRFKNVNTFRTKYGNNLDVIKNLKNYERQGYKIDVDGFKGKEAIERLTDFETQTIYDKLKEFKKGEHVKFDIQYPVQVNVYDKSIVIDTSKANIHKMSES